jgi:hypothetical protein
MTWLSSMARDVIALSMALASGAAQVSASPPPALVQGRVPIIPLFVPGQVTLRVTVRDGVPTNLAILSADPALLGQQSIEQFKQWRFAPGSQGEFDLRVRYLTPTHNKGCYFDRNPTLTANLPTDVELAIPPWSTCDPSTTTEPTGLVMRNLVGLIRCNCRGNRPLRGVLLDLGPEPPEPGGGGVHRTVRTDLDGRFRVDGLPDGQYRVGLNAEGFQNRGFVIRISRNAPTHPPIDWRLVEEPPPPLPPPTIVTGADIPLYPATARVNGVEGVVKLRLSMSDNEVLDINAEAESAVLSEAAIENVRTWSLAWTTAPVVHVTFTYKLAPGDCSGDQRTHVTMRVPSEVEVTAKRLIKCGA